MWPPGGGHGDAAGQPGLLVAHVQLNLLGADEAEVLGHERLAEEAEVEAGEVSGGAGSSLVASMGRRESGASWGCAGTDL